MVEFSENLESGPSGSGRPRQGHPRPQPILKPSRWAFSCCTPAMSPPTPEDELPEESPTQTPTPVPMPSSTTALGGSETTPPRAVVHAPSPSDEATRAAYIAAADFDDDVPLPGETLTSEELEFYSDVREEQDAPGEDPFTSGLPSWLQDTSDDEVLPATPVTQEPSMEPPVAGGESPGAERGAERGADDVADVSVADLLDAANTEDPAFAFKPHGVARAAFQSVLYGNYGGPVDDDETLGESSFERDPPARGRGDDDATPSPSRTRREDDDEDIEEEENRGSEVKRDVAKLWSDMHATRTARETRVQDMRAFLRRVRGGDDANDRRVKFPPSPATATGDESESLNESPESHPESRTAAGPTRVAAVSPRETAVRALEDRDWSPMLPSTRVGLQRLVDGDTAAVDDDDDENDENDRRRDEASTMDRPPVASTSELRTALGLPAKTQLKAGGTRRARAKKPHAERYAFGSSVETGRGEKWRLAAEAAEAADSNPPHFLRRGDGKPRSFIPTPHARSAIRADAAERQEARLREQWRRWRVSQRERKERMNAEAERTRATEESARGRGLRERPSNEANRDKDASVEHKPAGKRIVVRDEVEEEENEPGGSVVVEEEKEEEERDAGSLLLHHEHGRAVRFARCRCRHRRAGSHGRDLRGRRRTQGGAQHQRRRRWTA